MFLFMWYLTSPVANVFNLSVYSTGITPLCHVLFALYNPLSCCWYSPNHIFTPEENSSLVLHYCMRLVSDCVTLYVEERLAIFSYAVFFFIFS